MKVIGHAVVLNQTTIFRLILTDDAIGIIVDALSKMAGLSPAQVLGSISLFDPSGNLKAYPTVDTTLSLTIVFIVSMKHMNLIAKEVSFLASCMGQQRFIFTEFKFQFIM